MSVKQFPIPFRKWPRIQPSLWHPLPPSPFRTSIYPTIINDKREPGSFRLLHSTRSLKGTYRTPRIRWRDRRYVDIFTEDYRMNQEVYGDPSRFLEFVRRNHVEYTIGGKHIGDLPSYLNAKTFEQVLRQTVLVACKVPPSARAMKSISKDADIVWRIGILASDFARDEFSGMFRHWLTTAAAASGVENAIYTIAATFIYDNVVPMRTPILDQVEHLAVQEERPGAMILHAKVLGRRGQFSEAVVLMEKLMGRIHPTTRIPGRHDYIRVGGIIEPPWEIYAWLKESMGDHNATNKAIEMAALDYEDPQALIKYAHIKITEGDLVTYEECMSKAAMAGNAEACRRLANFYYLTFHGRYPRRGAAKKEEEERIESKKQESKDNLEKTQKSSPQPSSSKRTSTSNSSKASGSEPEEEGIPLLTRISEKISYIFGVSRPVREYYLLALDWYDLAAMHKSHKAAVIYAILLHERGMFDQAYDLLKFAKEDKSMRLIVNRLAEEWADPEHETKIPVKLLDT